MNEQGEGRSTIEIVSEPRVLATIVDYGKNQRNVNALMDAMR